MKYITTSNGYKAIVDDEDYPEISKWKWYCGKTATGHLYIFRKDFKSDRLVYIHREVTGAEKGQIVDHINHDTLDNRRENLRLCTSSQNNRNCIKNRRKKGYKGVYKHRSGWRADIHLGKGKGKLRKCFPCPIRAAVFYNVHCILLFGEYAHINKNL